MKIIVVIREGVGEFLSIVGGIVIDHQDFIQGTFERLSNKGLQGETQQRSTIISADNNRNFWLFYHRVHLGVFGRTLKQ